MKLVDPYFNYELILEIEGTKLEVHGDYAPSNGEQSEYCEWEKAYLIAGNQKFAISRMLGEIANDTLKELFLKRCREVYEDECGESQLIRAGVA